MILTTMHRLFLLYAICITSLYSNAIGFIPDLKVGSGVFDYACEGYFKGITIPVYYYIPQSGAIDEMPILFVMHGAHRNADNYRNHWIRKAEQYGIIVISPQFDKEQFPSRMYQSGNVKSGKNAIRPSEQMTYRIIDDIFLSIKIKIRSRQKQYNLYGHSAGGQFVHRFTIFYDSKYVNEAIAANPGHYTFPYNHSPYPYGLSGIARASDLPYEKIYGKKLTIMLGAADTLRDSNLNTMREADMQGLNRLERGRNFFRASEEHSNSLKSTFNWKLTIVEGAGHSNRKMSLAAADRLYGSK